MQDCLYGISKAIEKGLLSLGEFDPREYQYYENPA